MATNDIYGSKESFERIVLALEDKSILVKGTDKLILGKKFYYCKNEINLKYFHKLIKELDNQDMSFRRRLLYYGTLIKIVWWSEQDLALLNAEDISDMQGFFNKRFVTNDGRKSIVRVVKRLWKVIGLDIELIKDFKLNIDNARQKEKDKLTGEEFLKLIEAFNGNSKMQAWCWCIFEGLIRPQELAYIEKANVKVTDNYTELGITSHGKEGTGKLILIKGHPYITEWLDKHPGGKWLFCNTDYNKLQQMSTYTANKFIKAACKIAGIDKPITNYSLKRCGVTYLRTSGVSDMEIQHTARWTSTRQIKTYDKSNYADMKRVKLVRAGLLEPTKAELKIDVMTKKCLLCNHSNKLTDKYCSNCKRPLSREELIAQEDKNKNEIDSLKGQMQDILDRLKLQDLAKEKNI